MNDPGSSSQRDPVFHFPQDLFLVDQNFTQQPDHRVPSNMTQPLRRSSRHRAPSGSLGPSGSEYHGSDKSMEDLNEEEQQVEEEIVEYTRSSRGRRVVKKVYVESASEDDGKLASQLFDDENIETRSPRRSTRHSRSRGAEADIDDDEEDIGHVRYSTRARTRRRDSFIVTDEEDDKLAMSNTRYSTRSQTKKPTPPKQPQPLPPVKSGPSQRARRFAERNARRQKRDEEDVYEDHPTSSGASADADGSIDDAPHTSSDVDVQEPEPEPEPEEEGDGKPYALRVRQRINYAIPPPLEEMRRPPPSKPAGGARNNGGRSNHGFGVANRPKGRSLGWSASGAELGRWMGMGDDSDSDHVTRTPRKQYGATAGGGFGTMGNGIMGDLAAGGTPSNFGKINEKAILADADPLGVNVNVTFDEVGGLDEHIHSLKEMTLLPLLYPEVFQKFGVTPPRGVLFHGPPGTGKTLLARALATSCRSDGRSISFFMRKGADCLSKWVGEAERQLRLLFEEARASQPSIIFFDEIDGLAPVRSSKQDQIHASIVSTLLALMDGMDGRGQVVVIGATNRPDAVDPALRRPGRFDREFYFGLPGLEARAKILGIMTKGWVGWGLDRDDEKGEELEQGAEKEIGCVEMQVVTKKEVVIGTNIKGLAQLTKGYGGADLRALCTEAALNAVQRRYPQIYQSNERLLLNAETIAVTLRDFMVAIKKIIPSSARSTSSAATPLPPQFAPLLGDTVEHVKHVIGRVMPVEKPLTALQEAMFEDDGGEEGALEREMLSQSMQTLRIHRPRVVIYGAIGMGQGYVGAAALHHLEGYHIQSLELGTLLSDSTRTVEAAIVQLFVEAKRHQPSVIYIPSLIGWCAAVSETSRSTVRAMLDTLLPTDPILLLVVVDGSFSELPQDVKAWFGPLKDNRVELPTPSAEQRCAFFEPMLRDVQRPPNQFTDGVKRRKRVLEKLPVAPPLQPRQPTAIELAVQEENDQKLVALLKYRLGPILTELKRKFKRFTKRAAEEYHFDDYAMVPVDLPVQPVAIAHPEQPQVNGIVHITEGPEPDATVPDQPPLVNGQVNGDIHPHEEEQPEPPQPAVIYKAPPLFDIDLEKMHSDLFRGRYLTPQDFLDDVGKMVHNANVRAHEDLDRLYKAQAMFTAAQVSIQEFDPQFRLECERMAVRERKRREEARSQKEKERGKGPEDQVQGNGIRRSARNNGQQPELPIVDPVQLERRLKRQRSNEVSTDSHASEEEQENGVNRESKRTKVSGNDTDTDPLNMLSPAQAPRVHFEIDVQMQVSPGNQDATQPNTQPSESGMSVEDTAPRKHSGFDPMLLNPMPLPEIERNFARSRDTSPSLRSVPPESSSLTDPQNPFLSSEPPSTSTPTPLSPSGVPLSKSPVRVSKSPDPQAIPIAARSPTPMVVERQRTPLPDFLVDMQLLHELRKSLSEATYSLTIEELEQLRATCLGNVWRHRMDWNRDALVKELLDVVKEFVSEIAMSP